MRALHGHWAMSERSAKELWHAYNAPSSIAEFSFTEGGHHKLAPLLIVVTSRGMIIPSEPWLFALGWCSLWLLIRPPTFDCSCESTRRFPDLPICGIFQYGTYDGQGEYCVKLAWLGRLWPKWWVQYHNVGQSGTGPAGMSGRYKEAPVQRSEARGIIVRIHSIDRFVR
jgi:hypothetical protein